MDIKLNLSYYASIMLDAFKDLLCSKLCWHNRPRPSSNAFGKNLTNDGIKHMCIWPLAWHNKYKPYNSLIPLQQFLTFSLTSQREASKE